VSEGGLGADYHTCGIQVILCQKDASMGCYCAVTGRLNARLSKQGYGKWLNGLHEGYRKVGGV